MNANQINGTLTILVGKVQEQFGHAMRSNRQVLRGLQRQVLGAAEKRVGDHQESVRRTLAQRANLRH
jgi:uncharacterized protein YjbJ (UPF0337 family)